MTVRIESIHSVLKKIEERSFIKNSFKKIDGKNKDVLERIILRIKEDEPVTNEKIFSMTSIKNKLSPYSIYFLTRTLIDKIIEESFRIEKPKYLDSTCLIKLNEDTSSELFLILSPFNYAFNPSFFKSTYLNIETAKHYKILDVCFNKIKFLTKIKNGSTETWLEPSIYIGLIEISK